MAEYHQNPAQAADQSSKLLLRALMDFAAAPGERECCMTLTHRQELVKVLMQMPAVVLIKSWLKGAIDCKPYWSQEPCR